MGIVKNKLYKDYTMIPNWIINNPNISNNAFRLLIYLYSKPDNWNVRQMNIAKDLQVGKSTINNWLNELKDKKIVEVIRVGSGYEYHLKTDEYSVQEVGNQDVGTQEVGNQEVGLHNKTNTTKTNISNTEFNNTLVVLLDLVKKYNIKNDADIPKMRIKDIKDHSFKNEDIEKMLAYFSVEWNKPKMKKYLRVSTLFNNKFNTRVLEAKDAELDLRMLSAGSSDLTSEDVEVF